MTYFYVRIFIVFFSERVSCIIVVGGYGYEGSHVEVMTGDLRLKQIPNVPKEIQIPSMVLYEGDILRCGGARNRQKCLQLNHGMWKEHSTLNQERYGHSAVTTQTAIFLFGGYSSRKTYEYLPKGSSTWLMGKTEIPGGFSYGCSIAVKADQEIWLIGGLKTEKRVLSFNVKDHTFEELPFQLNVPGYRHRCAFIPNTNKIMITYDFLDFTEILDTENRSVTLASFVNSKRYDNGMGVLTIKGEDRLAVFGGQNARNEYLDCAEIYNSRTKKWETTDIKLNERKSFFSCLTVKLSDIISKM